jgi:autotransporter translocation and assembly factor TamB
MTARTRLLFTSLLLAVVAAVVAGTIYLRSGRFQEFARATITSRVSAATGMNCTIDSLRLNLLGGRFELRGVRLEPRAGNEEAFRLSVDEAAGRFLIRSLLGFRWNLRELRLVRPRLVLISSANSAGWNPDRFLRIFQTSLNLAIGQATITEGWFEMNQVRIPMELALEDFVCNIRYRDAAPAYEVRLSYRNSRLIWAERRLDYGLVVRATVSMDGIDVHSFEAEHGASRLRGTGWMRRWQAPAFVFHSEADLSAEDLILVHPMIKEARGRIQAEGNFGWDPKGFRATGRFWTPGGTFREVAAAALNGMFEIHSGVLRLHDVQAQVGTGTVQLNGELQLSSSIDRPDHNLRVAATKLALADIARILRVPMARLQNSVDSTVQISWRKGPDDLKIAGEVQLHPASADVAASGRGTSLLGHASFSYGAGTVYLSDAEFRSAGTTLSASGDGGKNFRVRLATTNLPELMHVGRGFSSALDETLARHPDLLTISGRYELDGEVSIVDARQVAYHGGMRIAGGTWRSYTVDTMSATASWNGPRLKLTSLSARQGRGQVKGILDLEVPGTGSTLRNMRFEGSVDNVTLESLKRMGIGIPGDISGTLSGSGTAALAEGSWRGDGKILLERGVARGETFDLVRAQMQLHGSVLRISEGLVRRGAAEVSVQGSFDAESRRMNLSGRLSDLPLQVLSAIRNRKLDVGGSVTGTGRLAGTPENPVFDGKFILRKLSYSSWNFGEGEGTVKLENRTVQAGASVKSEYGVFEARASVSTDSGFPGKAFLEFRDWNIRRLVASRMPPFLSDLSSALQGNVELEGRFAEPEKLMYRGELDGAHLNVHGYDLRNEGKIRFTGSQQKLLVSEVRMLGEGTSLVLSGEIPLESEAGLNLRLNGNLNLAIAEHFQKRARVNGSTTLDVRATGTLRDPQVIGQAVLTEARLEYGEIPFPLSALRGKIVFSRNLVRLEGVHGSVATGSVTVNGSLEHDSAQLRGMNVQISVRRARVPYPKDFRSSVDADLALSGTRDSPVLTGNIQVIRSEYMRDFNLLEQLVSRGPGSAGIQTSDPFVAGLRLNLSIQSDDGLYIDNELTRLRGGLRLTLRGTPVYPSLTGRVEASEGYVFFRGNRFEIVHASADFLDRNRINPVLDVRAEADVRSFRLLLDIAGDMDHLSINMSSDPPMSTVDIVSLLTTGKFRESGNESLRRQAEITGLSAASILSESLTGVIGKRVQRIFGFESFRVDPFLAGEENDPTARVTITERLSKDLAITFSRNLSTNEEQIVMLEYDVNRNLSLVATRDEDGKHGLDIRFRRRFR